MRGTGSIDRKTRTTLLVAAVVSLIVLGAAASFNFGITPSKAEKGVHERGERFFVSFFVVSGSSDSLDVAVDTDDAGVSAFQGIRPEDAANFSEEKCSGCVDFLKAGGALQDYEKGGSINQWKPVEFFVDVPEDAEPGYHMLNVHPRPVRSSGGGSVGVVSATSFPVIFRVPGKAIRSGKVLGVHTGRTFNDEQNIRTTFYNDGTVTIVARGRITVETTDGNVTLNAGRRRVAPGKTEGFTGRIDTEELAMHNGTFNAYATVNYATGKDTVATTLSPREPVEPVEPSGAVVQKEPSSSPAYTEYVLVILLLAGSTIVSWKVMQRVRY